MNAFSGVCGAVDLGHGLSDLSRLNGIPGSEDRIIAPGQRDIAGPSPLPFLTISADAQIHNRADLRRALGLSTLPEREWPDSRLILAAYEKWGTQCPEFLLGEFAFAIWDDRAHRLFCCRDHLGARPFFYWHAGSRLVFGSSQEFILGASGVPRALNRRKLAAMTVPRGQHFYSEETFYCGIQSLAPGTSLIAERGDIRLTTYWQPDYTAESRLKSEDEAFEYLRELLTNSVENRIRDAASVASLLSGGLDSSALTCLAAACLKKKNRSLIAISAVLPEESRRQFTDERAYIEEFRSCPNVDIEYVTAPGSGPFDDIHDPSGFTGAFNRISRFYLYDAIRDAAAARGADVLLDGVGGEMGPTFWAHSYYLELAVRFQWRTLGRELTSLQRTRGISPARMLGSQLFTALSPSRENRDGLVMLRPEFAGRNPVPPQKRHWPDHRRQQAAAVQAWLDSHASQRGQTVLGNLRFHYPFVDKRIVEFCLAAPGSMKVRNGYQRYLIRRALDGILPKKIQWRTNKHPASPDYYVRYNRQIGKARDFVAAIGPGDPVRSVVDVERLSGLVHPVDPVKGSPAALNRVPATIYLICFLRQFAEFRS